LRIPEQGDEMRAQVTHGMRMLHMFVCLMQDNEVLKTYEDLSEMAENDPELLVAIAYAGVILAQSAASFAFNFLDELHMGQATDEDDDD
jgi:hypothetical protein